MHLAGIDWAIIAVYGLFMLGAGLYFSRRASRSTTDFFISGRRLTWWVAGTSMVATTFAADTPLFVTSLVRSEGIAGNWIWFNFAISHALTTFFLAALWRRAKIVTDVELCELRYSGRPGRALRCFKGSFFAFITNSVILGWVLLAMATICEEVLGLPKIQTIAAGVLLATLYATVSGLWGVVATDLIQFGAAMLGSVVLMVKALGHVGGIRGFATVLPTLLADNGRAAMDILPPIFSPLKGGAGGAASGAGMAAAGTLGGFLVAIGVQWWSWKYSDGGGVLIQRMSATRNERHSVLAMLWFTFANYVVRPWPWFMVALISLVVFPELTDHKTAYPKMMAQFLGPGWLGLMMAAILAAFMSTVDTHINLAASYFVNDVYRRFLRRSSSEKHYVLIARLASVMFLCIGGLIAMFNTSIVKLFVFMLQLVAGAGVVFLLRWFWWRINAWSEISAMISSLIIATLLNICNSHAWIAHQFAPWEIFLINVVASAIVWIAVTFLTRPTESSHLLAFYQRVRPSGAWGPVAAHDLGMRQAADDPPAASEWKPKRQWECFLLTVLLVYTSLIGLGYFLYARWTSAVILSALALLAGMRVAWNLRQQDGGKTHREAQHDPLQP
ncbi:MAG: Na+:solute symporter [Candidatus Eisenbacteria sp.]|nr:Na+:solute symporter [Candidatus Eisenbacteria bacterium]